MQTCRSKDNAILTSPSLFENSGLNIIKFRKEIDIFVFTSILRQFTMDSNFFLNKAMFNERLYCDLNVNGI